MIARNPHTPAPRPGNTAGDTLRPVVAPEDWLKAQTARYAVKQYDPARGIDPAAWDALEQTLVLTPSSVGLQPWTFTVVDDPAVRARLREASFGQSQVTDAAKFVVFAARTGFSEADVDRFVARTAEVRGVSVASLAGLKGMAMGLVARPEPDRDAWAARQTYIALGNFLGAAAALGVDATPMEGFDPDAYDALLGLKERGYHAYAAAAAGHRSPEDKYAGLPKVRYAREAVIDRV